MKQPAALRFLPNFTFDEEAEHCLKTSKARRNYEKARQMQLAMLPLISSLFCEVNPIPIKKAMQLKGHCSSKLRLPLTEMTKENARKLANILEDY